tara:strand:+ start:715 stop:1422 length:708 start_codon:yes stop_codon:yes gene_type:complete
MASYQQQYIPGFDVNQYTRQSPGYAPDPFTYQMLMGQMGKGGQVIDKGLFRLFPQTAARAAGTAVPAGPNAAAAFTKGAAGVARLGSRRIPVLAGGIQALSGDPIGGAGTAGGGIAGGVIGGILTAGNPLGIAAGSMIGSSIGSPLAKGVANTVGGVVGINPNDPLSGPDWNIGPFAVTPYAKTKKRTRRGIELARMQMPLYDEIENKANERLMQRDMLQQRAQLVSNILTSSPY